MNKRIHKLFAVLAAVLLMLTLSVSVFAFGSTTVTAQVTHPRTVTVKPTVHGQVLIVKPDPVYDGDTVTFTVVPDKGYVLSSATCNGADITGRLVQGVYTLTVSGDAAFYAVFAAENTAVMPDSVTVEDGKIQCGEETIAVKTLSGGDLPPEKAEGAADAVRELLHNSAVENYATNVPDATRRSDEYLVAALQAKTTDNVAKGNVKAENISRYLDMDLLGADVDIDGNSTVTAVVFDVTPMASVTVTGADGSTVTLCTKIPNEEIRSPITFRLPVAASVPGETAAVYHEGVFMGNYPILGSAEDDRYIQVQSSTFSKFSYLVLNEKTAGAMIGSTLYAKFEEAAGQVTNGQTITLLKDASGTVTVSRTVRFTVDNNGKNNNAVIAAGEGYALEKSGNAYRITKNGFWHYDPDRTDSADTGDMGIALYGVLSVSTLLGIGWIRKRKHSAK